MSEKDPILIPFILPNSAEKLYAFSSEVLEKLRSVGVRDERQLKNIRLILIEMGTNSIKHVEDAEVSINILKTDKQLTISKSYVGKPISFKCTEDCFPFSKTGEVLRISFTENNNHHIEVLGSYYFKFINPFTLGDIEFLPENYGLSIITLASDKFTYSFDPVTAKNQFICQLEIA